MKRFALIVTIALACPAPTLLAQSRQHQVEPSSKDAPVADIVRSTMQLLGMEFEVTHERPAGMPLPPDLSRAKELLIPRAARFRVALPVLWGEQVLAPGEYRLGIIIDDTLEPFLRLKPVRGGSPRRLALELGNYSSPSDQGIVISLSSVRGDDEEFGVLAIRWGAVLFQGNFRPVRQRNTSLASLRLTSYEFPRLPVLPRELPLGVLRRSGAGEGEQLTLLVGEAGGPRLRFENRLYLTLLDDRRDLQQELARRKRSGAEKAELRRIEARLGGVEARLKGLDSEGTTREIPGTRAPNADAPTSGFDIGLIAVDDQSYLTVVVAGVRYRFSL